MLYAEMKLFGWLKATDASKRCFTQFLMYWWYMKFLSLTVFAFEGKENALLFCHNWQLCFPSSYHIWDQFLWTCPQKNICIANWLLLLKKKDLKLKLKEDEIIGGKKECYFRRLFGLLRGKQEISKVFYSFFVWSMKWVKRVFQTIIVQWKQNSSSQKKY